MDGKIMTCRNTYWYTSRFVANPNDLIQHPNLHGKMFNVLVIIYLFNWNRCSWNMQMYIWALQCKKEFSFCVIHKLIFIVIRSFFPKVQKYIQNIFPVTNIKISFRNVWCLQLTWFWVWKMHTFNRNSFSNKLLMHRKMISASYLLSKTTNMSYNYVIYMNIHMNENTNLYW